MSRCVKGLGLRKNIFMFSRSFLCKITRGDSPQNSCRFSFSFFPVEERERNKRKKTPPGQNSPVFRGRRRSALNAYVAEDAKFLRFFSDTYHLRPRDASAPPPSAAPSRSRHRRILHRRVSLRRTLLRHESSNRKQRPINYRRPPSTRAALWGADLCARNE